MALNGSCLVLLLWSVIVAANVVYADEFSPALLQIDEREGGWVDVTPMSEFA